TEDHDDELTVAPVEPTSPPMTTSVDNAAPEPAPEQPISKDWVSYEDYLAAPVPAPATSSAASTLPDAPMPSGVSSTDAVARGPKFEKALKRTKQSAITMAVLLGAVIVAGNLGLPVAVGGISLLGSMAAAVVTVVYGIVAIVYKSQNK